MKSVYAALLLALLAVPALAADTVTAAKAPAVDAKTLATQLAVVMPLDQQVTSFTEKLAATLPADKQAVFTGIMKKNVDLEKIRAAAADALVKTYTPSELQTMIEFYSKPEAKQIMAKMDQFGAALAPTVEAMVAKAVEESRKAGVLPAGPQS